jgi:AbrB family looped-hinge helix DNA binding protein
MKSQKSIIVNQKGMIIIPADLRKKYSIKPGSEVSIVELEGNLVIVPIVDIKSTRTISLKEMANTYDNSHDEELRLEE